MAWVVPVQEWLLERPLLTYLSMSALHTLILPWMAVGGLLGWFSAPSDELHGRIQLWSSVLWFCCGFIIPLVLGLTLDVDLGEAWVVALLWGPYFLSAACVWGLLQWERWYGYRKQTQAPRWFMFASLLLVACYLSTLETTVWAARLMGGVLGEGALFFGLVALGWLPLRITLHYATSDQRSQVFSIALAFGWLVLQLLATSPGEG